MALLRAGFMQSYPRAAGRRTQ